MDHRDNLYYKKLIEGVDEEEAIDVALAVVREAIEDTQRTNERLEKALDLMESHHLSR